MLASALPVGYEQSHVVRLIGIDVAFVGTGCVSAIGNLNGTTGERDNGRVGERPLVQLLS